LLFEQHAQCQGKLFMTNGASSSFWVMSTPFQHSTAWWNLTDPPWPL
jgi:hypothetical protein